MPGSASDYLENNLLDHSLGTTTYTKPTTVYAALYTVAPSDSTAGTEVTGGSYARKVITFAAASAGTTSNSANVDFDNMPAATVVAVAVMDAITSGNLLYWGTLTTSRTVTAGDSIRIATGALVVSLD